MTDINELIEPIKVAISLGARVPVIKGSIAYSTKMIPTLISDSREPLEEMIIKATIENCFFEYSKITNRNKFMSNSPDWTKNEDYKADLLKFTEYFFSNKPESQSEYNYLLERLNINDDIRELVVSSKS